MLGFGECDLEAFFLSVCAYEQELDGQGRFAGAGGTFDQIKAIAGEPPAKHLIEASHPAQSLGGPLHFCVHGPPMVHCEKFDRVSSQLPTNLTNDPRDGSNQAVVVRFGMSGVGLAHHGPAA